MDLFFSSSSLIKCLCVLRKTRFEPSVVLLVHLNVRTCVSGGGVPGAGRTERHEGRPGPGGLHQQEGGEADRDDGRVRGHALRGTPPDREATEGDRRVPEGTVWIGGAFPSRGGLLSTDLPLQLPLRRYTLTHWAQD